MDGADTVSRLRLPGLGRPAVSVFSCSSTTPTPKWSRSTTPTVRLLPRGSRWWRP